MRHSPHVISSPHGIRDISRIFYTHTYTHDDILHIYSISIPMYIAQHNSVHVHKTLLVLNETCETTVFGLCFMMKSKIKGE